MSLSQPSISVRLPALCAVSRGEPSTSEGVTGGQSDVPTVRLNCNLPSVLAGLTQVHLGRRQDATSKFFKDRWKLREVEKYSLIARPLL